MLRFDPLAICNGHRNHFIRTCLNFHLCIEVCTIALIKNCYLVLTAVYHALIDISRQIVHNLHSATVLRSHLQTHVTVIRISHHRLQQYRSTAHIDGPCIMIGTVPSGVAGNRIDFSDNRIFIHERFKAFLINHTINRSGARNCNSASIADFTCGCCDCYSTGGNCCYITTAAHSSNRFIAAGPMDNSIRIGRSKLCN